MSKRNLSFGTTSISIVVIVIGLVIIVNFLGAHNPMEADFTHNKIHTYSDQSEKVLQSLQSELKAEFYGEFAAKENFQPLFENYKKLSPLFKFEFIDPTKEPTRTKAAGITKMNTLLLSYQGRSIKLDGLSEEKVTNAIIKIEKDHQSVVCILVGHGETSVEDVTQTGMQSLKKALEDQSYVVNEISFPQQAAIPSNCNSILMMGVHGTFFPNEIKTLSAYLNSGGRAVIALDTVLNKKEALSKEFHDLLIPWGIDIKEGLIVDPETRKMGVDASLVMINTYNPRHPITKDSVQPSYFPFVRPVDFTPQAPAGFKIFPLAKTNEQAWAETDLNSFIKGKAEYNVGADIKGPLSIAVAASGKMSNSNAAHRTRVVVFGSSQFVDNQYSRIGGNLDFFMNSVSWILEDESLISIRTKEDDNGRVELSQKAGTLIFWLTVVIFPIAVGLFGVLIWLQRKRM